MAITALGAADSATSQVLRLQPGLLRQNAHRCRTKRDAVVVCEEDINPAWAFQNSMGGSALALDPPANPKQGRQGAFRLSGRPVLNRLVRQQ